MTLIGRFTWGVLLGVFWVATYLYSLVGETLCSYSLLCFAQP